MTTTAPTLAGLKADIPLTLAVQAHNGTSFVPEKRGDSEQTSYAEFLLDVHVRMTKAATRGGVLDQVDDEFARYRAGYHSRFTAYLRSRTRIVSTMIAGGSNFPARMMNKRNDISHKRLTELVSFQEAGLAAALRRLRPDLRPIMTGDADAIDRQRAKVVQLQIEQQQYKDINAALRRNAKKGRDAQYHALLAIGIKPTLALKLATPDGIYGTGIPSFTLSNLGATLRNAIKRLAHLEQMAEIPVTTTEAPTGEAIEVNAPENRVRITFPGKPDAMLRARLKSAGFRWTPSLGVWQAYCTPRNIQAAKDFVEASEQPAHVEAELGVANIHSGIFTVTHVGEENTYCTDTAGRRFFFKH